MPQVCQILQTISRTIDLAYLPSFQPSESCNRGASIYFVFCGGNVLVELVHPAVDGAQIPAKLVQFPEFEKGLFNQENQTRIARVNSIQTLLSDIDQLIYECGCDHRDETADELRQALIKFAYRYEVAGNGSRITKEIANSLISCFEYMGGSEVLEEILQWNVEFDEEARSTLENYEEE